MVKEGVKNEDEVIGVKSWIESRPFWERYLWKLHLEKEKIDDSDIDNCYKVFLDDQVFPKKYNTQNNSLTIPVFGIDNLTAAQAVLL